MTNDEVCYGALYDAAAKVLGKANKTCDIPAAGESSPFVSFCVRGEGHYYVLCSYSGTALAVLDTRTISKLAALKDTPGVRLEAVVQSSVFRKRRRGAGPKIQSFPVTLNIFGSRSAADSAGSQLSKLGAYLQHPELLHSDIEYHNPQFLAFPDDALNMSDFVGVGNKRNNALCDLQMKVSEEVDRIFGSLAETTVDSGLVIPTGLKSTLKRHQKDGLGFILQREDEQFSEKLTAKLCQATSIPGKDARPTSLGGLIADVMGLGKTLTIITAILYTLPVAVIFGKFHTRSAYELDERVPTKATLVVVSSAQLLESWESEMQQHVVKGALGSLRFHGQTRPRDLESLTSADVVLTTYATLVADHSSQGILHRMEWYRVVLDEAHWIRNSSSKQFRAVAKLSTKRRWCLTATPIQNRMGDLISIAQFLQLSPVPTRTAFHKYIVNPLSEGGPEFAKPLRTYLEAYCLRRGRSCLALPPSHDQDLVLSLSTEEQQLYTLLLDKTKRQMDSVVSNGDTVKCSLLFTAMLKMRMLCNLGTFATLEKTTGSLRKPQFDSSCAQCSATDEDTLALLSNCALCPDCGRQLRPSSPFLAHPNSPSSNADSGYDDGDTILNDTIQVLTAPTRPSIPNAISAKLSAIVQNIINSEPEDKSIIFSCWTSTLDVLSQLLRQADISYRQVDGRVSYAERSVRLEAFRNGLQVPVLLMSIGTGALGLNLTAANQIHIVEPQWNPSVEEQAIGRALRMGQKREVKVIRYCMKNTVEQNIIELQKRKKRLAGFTLDTEAQESISGTVEDLEFVLNVGSR